MPTSVQDDKNRDKKLISIIVCSINEKKFASVSKNLGDRLEGEAYEIIGIHDAKSLCEGYNRGAEESTGSILIFCHDDIEIVSPDFSKKIRKYLQHYDMVGVAGTSRLANFNWMLSGQPYIHGVVTQIAPNTNELVILVFGADQPVSENIQALDGLFIAMKRRVWEEIRFDEKTFDAFHGYDVDFSFSAYLAGFRLAICNDIGIIHQSVGAYGDDWYVYQDRFMRKHQGSLHGGEVAPPERGAIHVANREEILEMLNPGILQRVTNDIRALAAQQIAAPKRPPVCPAQKKHFWARLTGLWSSKG